MLQVSRNLIDADSTFIDRNATERAIREASNLSVANA
jgi:hypothetical protein